MAGYVMMNRCGVLSVAVKAIKKWGVPTNPSRILNELSLWMMVQLADGREVRFPGLGTFYAKKLLCKIPKDVRKEVYGTPQWETEEREVITIRFRPSELARKRLRMFLKTGKGEA